MIGLRVDDRPLLRAYSVVSTNYDETLEFFSIKVPDGPLTSRLQHLKVGDPIIVGKKATGTLVLDNLRHGKHLYLLGTGTGLAPFLSLIRDPETYERFEKVVLVHGCRQVAELAYGEMITRTLLEDEFLGEFVREQLIYYPDRDARGFPQPRPHHRPHALGQVLRGYRAAAARPESTTASSTLRQPADARRPQGACSWSTALQEGNHGEPGDFVIERAFVEK